MSDFANKDAQLSGPSRIRQLLGSILDSDPEIDLATLGREIGVSSTVFRDLLKSDVEFSSLSHESLRRLAKLVSMPPGLLYRELGMLGPEDFYEDPADLERMIDDLYEQMRIDDEFSALAPTYADWKNTPLTSRVALAACYEKAQGITVGGRSLNQALANCGQKTR